MGLDTIQGELTMLSLCLDDAIEAMQNDDVDNSEDEIDSAQMHLRNALYFLAELEPQTERKRKTKMSKKGYVPYKAPGHAAPKAPPGPKKWPTPKTAPTPGKRK